MEVFGCNYSFVFTLPSFNKCFIDNGLNGISSMVDKTNEIIYFQQINRIQKKLFESQLKIILNDLLSIDKCNSRMSVFVKTLILQLLLQHANGLNNKNTSQLFSHISQVNGNLEYTADETPKSFVLFLNEMKKDGLLKKQHMIDEWRLNVEQCNQFIQLHFTDNKSMSRFVNEMTRIISERRAYMDHVLDRIYCSRFNWTQSYLLSTMVNHIQCVILCLLSRLEIESQKSYHIHNAGFYQKPPLGHFVDAIAACESDSKEDIMLHVFILNSLG